MRSRQQGGPAIADERPSSKVCGACGWALAFGPPPTSGRPEDGVLCGNVQFLGEEIFAGNEEPVTGPEWITRVEALSEPGDTAPECPGWKPKEDRSWV